MTKNNPTKMPGLQAKVRIRDAVAPWLFNFIAWCSKNAHGKVIKLVQGITFPEKATMLDNLDGALAVGVDWGTRMYRRNT